MTMEKKPGTLGGMETPPPGPAAIQKGYLNDWVELFYRSNEKLNSFTDSNYTKKLSKFINVDALQQMVRTYRIILKLQEEEYIGDFNKMKREFKAITAHLKKLQKSGWLNPSDRGEVEELLFVRIMGSSRQGLESIRDNIIGKSIGRPKNIALDAMTYWLCESLKRATGKPKYNLVMHFLHEQNISNEWEDDEDKAKKRLQRLDPKILRERYEKIKAAAIVTLILNPKINVPEELTTFFADLLIPPFDSFLV